MRSAVLAAWAGFALVAAGQATPRWTALGPSGGKVADVLVAPSQARIAYAVSDSIIPSLYRTDDGGVTWQLASQGFFRTLDAVDPHRPDHLVAHGLDGLIASDDGGATFSSIDPGIQPIFSGAAVFLPAPARGILTAQCGGTYHSVDGGAHWKLDGFAGRCPSSVAVSPHDPNLRFAREDDDSVPPPGGRFGLGSLLRSEDGGRTWSESGWSAGDAGDTSAFAWDGPFFDPRQPAVMYLLAGGLFVSDDSGRTWTQAAASPRIDLLRVSPADGRLFASGGDGLFVSQDRGKSWSRLPASGRSGPPDETLALALSPSRTSVAFAAGERGLWRTGDGGRTWIASSFGIHRLITHSVAISPDGATAYTNIPGEGVFRGDGAQPLWQRKIRGLHAEPTQALDAFLATDGVHADRVWLVTGSGLYRSDDRAESWQQINILGASLGASPSYAPFALAGDRLMIGSGTTQLSEDGGQTWRRLNVPSSTPVVQLAFDSGNPDRLYATTQSGLLRSDDRGRTWTAPGAAGLPPLIFSPALWSHPTHAGELYLSAGSDGFYRSRDGGATFEHLTSGPSGHELSVEDLRIDPASPEDLYVLASATDSSGLVGGNLWRYSDAEHQFSAAPTTGGPFHALGLATHPLSPGTVWIASLEGVFRLDSF